MELERYFSCFTPVIMGKFYDQFVNTDLTLTYEDNLRVTQFMLGFAGFQLS